MGVYPLQVVRAAELGVTQRFRRPLDQLNNLHVVVDYLVPLQDCLQSHGRAPDWGGIWRYLHVV